MGRLDRERRQAIAEKKALPFKMVRAAQSLRQAAERCHELFGPESTNTALEQLKVEIPEPETLTPDKEVV